MNTNNIKSCNSCGGETKEAIKAIDCGVISESETKCESCGFVDYFSYGGYESSQEKLKEINNPTPTFGPTKNGSRRCESGSVASGGNKTHCSCDICF
jgi:hypothetical protein